MDVRAAMALVAGGDVDVGIVYRTDAMLEDRVEILFEIMQGKTRPIRYPIAVLKEAADPVEAARLAEFLLGDDGERLFQSFGFEVIR
jgi:molybdate transport system substrate-binding protein